MAIASAVLFMSSSVRAFQFADTARATMDATFPAPPCSPEVPGQFSFAKIWRIGGTKTVEIAPLPFQEFTGNELSLDLYPAQGQSAPGPCLVIVHGGGWDRGSRKEFESASHRLAGRGITV